MTLVKLDAISLGSGTIDGAFNAGGTFFSCLPISPVEYRKRHKTQASIEIDGSLVKFTDDWGHVSRIEIESAPDEWWQVFRESLALNELLESKV